MRLAARLLAPALGAALALGCAGSRPPPPPPKPPLVEAKGALPPDLDLVVRIDLARVRSALGPAVVADLRRAAQASSGLQGTESLLAPLFAFEMLFLGGHVELSARTIAAFLYVGIFPSFVGYVFWNRGVAQVGPNVAGLFVHLMPAFGAFLGWLLLDERIYAFHIVGIVLILAGIALTARGHRADPEPGPE